MPDNCVLKYPFLCVYDNFHYYYRCFPEADTTDPRFIILIDRSSSMATEVTRPGAEATTRLEAAKKLAASHARDIFSRWDHPLVSVMCFTAIEPNTDFAYYTDYDPDSPSSPRPPRVQVVCNFSDRLEEEVLDAISKIPEPTGESCLAEALCFAADVLQCQSDLADKFLYLYTDGGQDDWEWVDVLGSESCHTCNACFGSHNWNWESGCIPWRCDGGGTNPCADLQCCLADAFAASVPMRVTYFGPVTNRYPFPPSTSHPDFTFLYWLGNLSPDGGFEHVTDHNVFPFWIDRTQSLQGVPQTVPIDGILLDPLYEYKLDLGGLDLVIGYDETALTLTNAIPGELLRACGWEYFTYRLGVNGNCGDACPSGLVRTIAIAETNNGANHPSCYGPPDSKPHELVEMTFLVTDDRTFECQFVPIYFFWSDCGDNAFSNVTGDTLYIDRTIRDHEGNLIWDEDDDDQFPEDARIPFVGAPDYCLNPDPDKPSAIRWIDFFDGGIDIVCSDSIDVRGDINLNEIGYEVADAVLFANYFVYGTSVFNVNVEGQIAASDVNADGITLSVADLVYLIRVVVGDAMPHPKAVMPVVAHHEHRPDGAITVVEDVSVGAALVVVEGNVIPTLLAHHMDLLYNFDGKNTRILVYSLDGESFTGDFLKLDGKVLSVEMATADGSPVIGELRPSHFSLHQNYPNPFNPITRLSFDVAEPVDYVLTIYNISGQTVKQFSGRAEPGTKRVEWDASACASGVYLYKLEAGNFTDTKKMVLLK
jgi:hypothetical protein